MRTHFGISLLLKLNYADTEKRTSLSDAGSTCGGGPQEILAPGPGQNEEETTAESNEDWRGRAVSADHGLLCRSGAGVTSQPKLTAAV